MSELAKNNGNGSNGNGKPASIPEPPVDHPGGRGDSQPDISLSTMQTLRAAIRQGWELRPDYFRLFPGVLAQIIVAPGTPQREKRQAIRTLALMHRSNVEQAAALDKMDRLDQGEPTERVQLMPITLRTVERIE